MKSLNMLLSHQLLGHRDFFLVLCALLIFLGCSARANAQGCDNNDWISNGYIYCISATSSSGNNPQMPNLFYSTFGPYCSTAYYMMELDFAQPGDIYGNGQSYGLYGSPPLPGNTVWVVDWSLNFGDYGQYGEGGEGALDVQLDGIDYGYFTFFFVGGQNPTTTSITAVLNSFNPPPPLWYGKVLTWETNSANPPFGNVQFNYSNLVQNVDYASTPVFGPPDGFGLSQIDGSTYANPTILNDQSLWTWTVNLLQGVTVANSYQAQAQSFWNGNWAQWQQWAATQTPAVAAAQYPISLACGSAYFTATGTGISQYYNLFQITAYNKGTINSNNAWASVNPKTGVWVYNSNYATSVCSVPSYTLPD